MLEMPNTPTCPGALSQVGSRMRPTQCICVSLQVQALFPLCTNAAFSGLLLVTDWSLANFYKVFKTL